MKTYKVMAQHTTYVYAFIEAENEEQAWELAKDLDGGMFTDSGFGDWDVTNIDEEKP